MKRKIVCGIALCLALSAAGCGKSQEQQASSYYQNELGMTEDEADELAHELYGSDNNEPGEAEEEEPIVIEPLPELLDSEWYEGKVQVYDMVFSNDMTMTADDIRRIAEASEYEVEIDEGFDKNGNVVIEKLVVNGTWYLLKHGNNGEDYGELVENGLLENGDYYIFDSSYGYFIYDENCFDKSSLEFKSLGSREDVLTYLAENGYVDVEEKQALYSRYYGTTVLRSDGNNGEYDAEYADTSHYFTYGVEQVTVCRMTQIGETNEEIAYQGRVFSGGHVNLVDIVSIYFNTDGTIQRVIHNELRMCLIMGEEL